MAFQLVVGIDIVVVIVYACGSFANFRLMCSRDAFGVPQPVLDAFRLISGIEKVPNDIMATDMQSCPIIAFWALCVCA